MTLEIPDALAQMLNEGQDQLSQRAFETLIADGYRKGQLHKPDLRQLLGFQTSYEIDGFLKSHGVVDDYTIEEFERERQTLKDLGY